MASTKKPIAPQHIYQLRVALLDIAPVIWRHRVVVEGIMAVTPYNDWPLCLTGENACPPEDIGGPGGFEDFVQSMADPEDDDHFPNWTWHGGPFDPKGFDVNSTNARIRDLR